MAARRHALTLAGFLVSMLLPVILTGQTVGESSWNPITGPPAGSKFAGDKVCSRVTFSKQQPMRQLPCQMQGPVPPTAQFCAPIPGFFIATAGFNFESGFKETGPFIPSVTGRKQYPSRLFGRWEWGLPGKPRSSLMTDLTSKA
jgi:hypothetical protein